MPIGPTSAGGTATGRVDVAARRTSTVSVVAPSGGVSLLPSAAAEGVPAESTPDVPGCVGRGAVIGAGGDVAFGSTVLATSRAEALGLAASGGLAGGGIEVTADLNPTVKTFTDGGGAIRGAAVSFISDVNKDSAGN